MRSALFALVLLGITLVQPEPDATLSLLATLFRRALMLTLAPLVITVLIRMLGGEGRPSVRDVVRMAALAIVGLLWVLVNAGPALHGAASIGIVPLLVEHAVPQSGAAAAAENELLQLLFFGGLFGLAVRRSGQRTRDTILEAANALRRVMFGVAALVLFLAPVGYGALLLLLFRGNAPDDRLVLGPVFAGVTLMLLRGRAGGIARE